MALRNYSASAVGTTLSAGVNSTVTTIPVTATTGFPSAPFIAIIEPDTTLEEVVLVTAVVGLNLTVTRGYDSTTAAAHVSGSRFQHSFSAIDFREPNTFLNSGGTVGGAVSVGVGANALSLNPGSADHTYMALYARTSTPAVRSGYFGFPGAASNALTLANEISTGSIALTTNAGSIALTGDTTIIGTLNPTNVADTATAASHYFVETGSDGLIRPKILANVKTEIVTTAAVNAAAATTVGTVTSGTWNASLVAGQYGGTGVANTGKTITVSGNTVLGSTTDTVTLATAGNTSVTLPTTGTLVNTAVATLSSLVSIGTITTGTWNASVVAGQFGGTGVANTGKTLTLSGNTTIGSSTHTVSFATSANTSVTLPTTGTLVNDAVTTLSSLASVGTVTAGTWQSAINRATITAPNETFNIVASAITGTVACYYRTAQNWYYTTASTAGACTINLTGDATPTTLNTILATGQSATFTFTAATGATTPGYFSVVQVDGTATGVTTKWQYGSAPTVGSTSSTDSYTFTVLKTASATFTVFASFAKFG